MSLALVTSLLVVLWPLAPAQAAEAIGVTKEADETVLIGDPAEVTLHAANSGDVPTYNLTFRDVLPVGVSYVAGSTEPATHGEPTIYTDSVTGRQTLIWSNISDLPVGAQQELDFWVLADPDVLPVGSSFDNTANGYVNNDPRFIPRFDSTGQPIGGATASGTSAPAHTLITAIEVEKDEPSPEHELVRGVHAHSTVYTLTVTNNDLNPNNDTVLVDYLPAGLEFLGCGDVDHTTGGGTEYPTAPRLDASTPDISNCVTPTSVETVADPAGLPAGIYTRVEWPLGDLASSDVIVIQYAAGIPQRANTLTFPDGAPTPESLEQAANLDNNTGPSTLETSAELGLTNHARVESDYQGDVADGTSPQVFATDALTVTAEDVAVHKTVTPETFTHGGVATYSLTVRLGEYADAEDIVLVDELPAGLCPLDGPGTNLDPSDPECAAPASSSAPSHPFSAVKNGDGSWSLTFDGFDASASDTVVVTYDARMRPTDGGTDAPTVAGDTYVNEVFLDATTTTLTEVDPPGGVTTQNVEDYSWAEIESDSVSLRKLIQPNTGPTPYECSTDISDYTENAEATDPDLLFTEGSRVCFVIEVTFPNGNDTKNPTLTDFLPDYLDYEIGSAQPMPNNSVGNVNFDETDLRFTMGDTVGADRFARLGQVFAYRLSGIVNSSSTGDVDITGNLAKLLWVNTDGVVDFLRDRVDFAIAPPPPVTIEKETSDADLMIRGGDVATFTLTVGNAGTTDDGSDRDILGPDVWDRLPAGLTCADVSAISDAGDCTDPGDAGHPHFTGAAERSAIRWQLPDSDPGAVRIAPGDTYELTYQVTYRETVAAGGKSYRNDVDVASYSSETNLGTLVPHYPADNVDLDVPPEDIDVPAAHDDLTLTTPVLAITKTNVTEVDDAIQGANPTGLNYATIGETVTYEVIGTVPADTTVYSGRLFDTPPSGLRIDSRTYSFRDAPGSAWTTLPAGATGSATGNPTVTLPATWATGDDADGFRMVITATVLDAGVNVHARVATNTARFQSVHETGGTPSGPQAKSRVTVVEPRPAPTKVADNEVVRAGDTAEYTVTARNLNPANPSQMRPPLHDSVLVDCVPGGLVVQGTPTVSHGSVLVFAAGVDPRCAADRTTIEWTIGTLEWRSTAAANGADPWPTMVYEVQVAPQAAGASTYTNTVAESGTSMSGADADERTYSTPASETISVPPGTLVKTVDPASALVGDRVEYSVEVSIPARVNFFDAIIADDLPGGIDPASLAFVSASCSYADGAQEACGPDVAVPTAADMLGPDGQTHGFALGDLAANTRDRVITITYYAVISATTASNTAGTPLTNSASLKWFLADQPGTPDLDDPFDEEGEDGEATVTVLEPLLSITKDVSDETPVPGEEFTYTVTVTNASGSDRSPAHNVDISDALPAGIAVVAGSISNSGSLSGSTITWSDLGPIAPGSNLVLTYRAKLVTPAPSATQTNVADITEYTSLPDPTRGREYDGPTDDATITPGLPEIEVVKSVLDAPPAYIDESTAWRIVVTNNGPATAHDVDVADVLPANWNYDVDSARVVLPGGSPTPVEPVVTGDPENLTWDAVGTLASGESLTIEFTATPNSGVAPGQVGSAVDHINSVTATAQDLPTTEGGNVVTQDDDDAETHIDAANLVVDKIAGAAEAVAGEDFDWLITVTNEGPDIAVGPFTVTDTLPGQVTGATATGDGWTCSVDLSGTITCHRANPGDTLATGASFPVIAVTAHVPDDVTPSTNLVNDVEVSGRTHETDYDNNEDDASTPVAAIADFSIDKELVGDFVPGADVSYTLQVENHGPSVSRGPIVVTDTLPAELTYVSASGSNWHVSQTGQTLTFTWVGAVPVQVGPLPQINLTATLDSSVTSTVTNTASVTEPTDPTTGTEEPDSDDEPGTPTPRADLSLSKSSLGDFMAGTTGVYEFVVNNHGPSDAAGPVVITDQLPGSLSYASVFSADGWTCSATGQDVECSLAGGLAAGATSTLQVSANISPDLKGEIANTATVESPTDDPNTPNNSDDDDTGIDVEADLGIVKTLTTDPVVAGEEVAYELVVTNNGPSTSPGTITVSDSLPTGLTYVSAVGTGWACSNSGQAITCERTASLSPNQSAPTITVRADVASGIGTTTLTNVANVDGPATDPDPSNNTDDADTPVTEDTEIEVTKNLTSANPVRAGEIATFELVVSNTGSSDARSVEVDDSLPAGMTLQSMSGTGWTCSGDTCSRDRIVAGTSAPPITVTALVGAGVPDGTTLNNQVDVSTPTPGDTPDGNHDEAEVDVVAEADLALVKSHASGVVVAGTGTEFTLTVSNNGPSDAVGPLTITDTLPNGMSFTSAAAPWSCSATDDEVTCTLPDGLAAGSSAPDLTLRAWVDQAQPAGPMTNTAVVGSPTTDPDPSNNEDPEEVVIEGIADLTITKTHTGPVHVGDTFDFELIVTNAGPSIAGNVVVTDPLPTGLELVSATGTDWTCAGTDVVSCELAGALRATESTEPITVTVLVTPAAYPSVTNVATVETTTPESDPDNNEATDEVEVPPLVDLSITKVHRGKFTVGETGTYRIRVKNHGPTADPGPVTITDVLPEGLAYVSATGAGADCAGAGGTVTCTLPAGLDVGEVVVLTLEVEVQAAAYPEVANTAVVSSDSEDTDPDNNESTDLVPVKPTVELGITKEAVTVTRTRVVYRLTITNHGPNDTVKPVRVRDALPGQLTLASVEAPGWSCTTAKRLVDCTFTDPIKVGAAKVIRVVTDVVTSGKITNTATVIGGGDKTKSDDVETVVVPPTTGPDRPDGLPQTGGAPLWMLLLGLALFGGGGLLLLAQRRRQ